MGGCKYETEYSGRGTGGYIIINQVRNPQCFVVGFEGSLSLSLSLSLEGVSLSTVVGQACFVRQSSLRTPSRKDRKWSS